MDTLRMKGAVVDYTDTPDCVRADGLSMGFMELRNTLIPFAKIIRSLASCAVPEPV